MDENNFGDAEFKKEAVTQELLDRFKDVEGEEAEGTMYGGTSNDNSKKSLFGRLSQHKNKKSGLN